MKTRVKVVFPTVEFDQPTWPYIGYDVEVRSNEVIGLLRKRLPQMEFTPELCRTRKEAQQGAEAAGFDGYLVFMSSLWTGVGEVYARTARPVIIADDIYAGSGGLLRVHSIVRRENLPVVTVASSDMQDLVDAVRLFDVMRRMRETRIVVVTDGHRAGNQGVQDLFGTDVIQVSSEELRAYYERTVEAESELWKDKWIREALRVVEPDEEEIRRSARLYLAMKAVLADKKADAITVNCLGLFYGGKLPAYPCLGFFQLNNEGTTGVCEADVDSTVTQLLIRYAFGVPGYVSDPVIDTATNQIIYAHCVAANRPFGPEGLPNPYIIRSHAEDGKGASVQSLLPLGHPVTTVKVSVANKAFAVHGGRAVANIHDEKGCRTKLAAETDALKILDNYRFDVFGWHRVTCYGDVRKPLTNLARLYGLSLHEEDR